QALHEVHRDVAPVDVAVVVEDIDLEQHAAAADRRPRADARDAVQEIGPEPADARGEDPVDRRLAALQMHVRGRKAELAAQAQAGHDAARDRVVAPEHGLRGREIAGRERRAYRRAADALPFAVDG